jgi:hypothetical protein
MLLFVIYIQQDDNVTQFILSGNCSTCFGRYHHPSSEAHTTVSTASGVCYTVIAVCCYPERVGTGFSVLCCVISDVPHLQHNTATMSMKNSNDTIGNRTRDLPTCSAVPPPPALPRAPIIYKYLLKYME